MMRAVKLACLLGPSLIFGCSAQGSDLPDGTSGSGNVSGGGSGGVSGGGSGGVVPPPGGGSGTGATSGSGGTGNGSGYQLLIDPGCDSTVVEFESVIPTVMILVDRSSSMFDTPYGLYPSRWQPLKDALVGDGMNYWGVVGDLQNVVRFGFAAYTSQKAIALQVTTTPGGVDYTGVWTGQCPLVLGANVPIGLSNYMPIRAAYDQGSYDPILDGGGTNLAFKGETPTGEAIDTVAALLASYPEPGPKYILLVTDGQPDTCGVPDPQCGQDNAVRAAQGARQLGISTFVIGINMTEFDAARHLNQIANAGIGLPVEQGAVFPNCGAWPALLPGGGTSAAYSTPGGTAQAYLPEDPTRLQSDVVAVIGSMRSCTYDMTSVVVNTQLANTGSVQLQDQVLVYDDPNGWRMNNGTQLELLGTACDVIRHTPQPFLYVSFPCDVLLPR
jgi:hypothetical protein